MTGIYIKENFFIVNHKILILILSFAITKAGFAKSAIEIYGLTTEYKTDPIGMGTLQPRLSWKIRGDQRNIRQVSYQIIAANSISDLKKGKNLIWNSGKVKSSKSILIPYAGKTLSSRQRVYWKVIVDTNVGESTSESAFFEMGILSTTDWQAKWIQADYKQKKMTDPCPYLRKEFDIKKEIKQARLYASAIGVYLQSKNSIR